MCGIKIDVKPDKKHILTAAGCVEGSDVYETVSRYYDELYDEFIKKIKARCFFRRENEKIYCAVTVGMEISEMTGNLFDSGEAVKGLLSDVFADECLFEADKALSDIIRKELLKESLGVLRRQSAPEDFPLSGQKTILDNCGADGITVTDAFMLSPVKSMAYILELTNDKNIFKAQHDCSKCKNKDCPRRSAPYAGEIVSSYRYAPSGFNGSAVCIDIGTTTIAMEYIADGGVIKTYKTVNPQRRFGADVLSRIDAANRGRGDELRSIIRFSIKKGITEITDGNNPDKIIISANTTMVHLLMNYPCTSLGVYPFKSEHLETLKTEICDIPSTVIGGISAFVGGDIVSGIYMTDMDLSDKVNLFIDLGTNGEMAIGNKKRIIATSSAAGPAFEGGKLSFASKGTDVIDILAYMLDKGIIDHSGALLERYLKNGYRFKDTVTVFQQDIREIQTAKAAVRAGIECLINAFGTDYHSIANVYLAGGMGCGLSVSNAAKIGILPAELADKTVAVGNSSLGGAVKFACEDGFLRVENIRKISRHFSLASHKDFEKSYIEYMDFSAQCANEEL